MKSKHKKYFQDKKDAQRWREYIASPDAKKIKQLMSLENGIVERSDDDDNQIIMDKEHIFTRSLSLEARGFFDLILCLPKNWRFSQNGLATIAGISPKKVQRLLKELDDNGYFQYERPYSIHGKFYYFYHFYEKSKKPSSLDLEWLQKKEEPLPELFPEFDAQESDEDMDYNLEDESASECEPPDDHQSPSKDKPEDSSGLSFDVPLPF